MAGRGAVTWTKMARRAIEEYGRVSAIDIHPGQCVKAAGSHNVCAKVMVTISIFSFNIVS